MILKKPFAFFIKHFKLIHLILAISACFLVIKTNSILSFYLEYMDLMNVASGMMISEELFSIYLFVFIVIIILGSILIAGLMKTKEKPIVFYAINILIYIYVATIYIASYNVTKSLEIGLVDIRTLKMIQDFLVLAMIFQVFSAILLIIRALGFDVKKFDFERDLEQLEITSEDSEEIEVNLEFDFDKFKRNFRRRIRHFRYVYLENKVVINIIFLIIALVLAVLIYLKIGVYDKVYKENQVFKITNYQIKIKETYNVNTNYYGEQIDDATTFIVVKANIKSYLEKEIKFESARLALEINNHLFHHQKKYKDSFKDLGNIYLNQKVKNEASDYLFVFQIPKDYANKDINLKYFDYDNKEISVNLKPNDFSDEKLYNYNLGDKINLTDSILKNTTIKINSIEISDYFRNNYKFCVTDLECLDSYEYLVPTYTGNEDKALLKITGVLNWDNDQKIEGIDNLYDFISTYSTITYILDQEEKEMNIKLKQVKPSNSDEDNVYYIEVPKEIKEAKKIYINFIIRDKKYKYAVK